MELEKERLDRGEPREEKASGKKKYPSQMRTGKCPQDWMIMRYHHGGERGGEDRNQMAKAFKCNWTVYSSQKFGHKKCVIHVPFVTSLSRSTRYICRGRGGREREHTSLLEPREEQKDRDANKLLLLFIFLILEKNSE